MLIIPAIRKLTEKDFLSLWPTWATYQDRLKVKEKGWGTPDCFPEYFPDLCDADLFASDFRSLFSFQYIYYLFLIFLSNILNLYSN